MSTGISSSSGVVKTVEAEVGLSEAEVEPDL